MAVGKGSLARLSNAAKEETKAETMKKAAVTEEIQDKQEAKTGETEAAKTDAAKTPKKRSTRRKTAPKKETLETVQECIETTKENATAKKEILSEAEKAEEKLTEAAAEGKQKESDKKENKNHAQLGAETSVHYGITKKLPSYLL